MKWNFCKKITLLVFCCFLFNFTSLYAQAHQSWPEFVSQLRVEAIAQGIRPEIFDQAFQDIKEPSKQVLRFDRTQPEHRITFIKYRNTRADAFRIKLGRREFRKYYAILNEIGEKYGVSPSFIISIWGMETSYGRYMGNFPVIKSLATLAYDNRRKDFFRAELFLALHILNEGHVSLKDFRGEWAGASGHPQFMPSSWRRYAVDYDNKGRKDIWRNLNDSFASIANYLVINGWRRGEPWSIPVSLPPNIDKQLIDLHVTKSVEEWKRLGIQPLNDALPSQNLPASIIEPEGGPAFMVFNNFKVLMKWNRSIYYAETIGYMAEQIAQSKL